MAFWGKDKLKESDAAKGFVSYIAEHFQNDWKETANKLKTIFPSGDLIFNDGRTPTEFFFAVVAVQTQALHNLLPTDQANRIREYIIEGISHPELGEYPRQVIQEYQIAWNRSLQRHENPSIAIADVLWGKIAGDSTDSINGPLHLTILSSTIVNFCGFWWKACTNKFKIVP